VERGDVTHALASSLFTPGRAEWGPRWGETDETKALEKEIGVLEGVMGRLPTASPCYKKGNFSTGMTIAAKIMMWSKSTY